MENEDKVADFAFWMMFEAPDTEEEFKQEVRKRIDTLDTSSPADDIPHKNRVPQCHTEDSADKGQK